MIVPVQVGHDQAYLYITSGNDRDDPAPARRPDRFAKGGRRDRKSVVAELDSDVPNQPLRFAEGPDAQGRASRTRSSPTRRRIPKDRNPLDLVRLPMVKSGTQAMTAVQQYLASDAGGKLKIDGFVVSGGSKRAWTTWLVGALDKRVVAIIPIGINTLNLEASRRHQWEAMGYFSPAIKDYVENGLVPGASGPWTDE